DASRVRLRPTDDADRASVQAPLRRALDRIVTWGAIGYGLAAAAVALPALAPVPPVVGDAAHLALPLLVLCHLAIRTALRLAHGAPTDAASTVAWAEARSVDPGTAVLARVVVGAGSGGLLLAGFVLVAPHLTGPGAGAYVALYVPVLVALWAVATVCLVEGARDRIAYGVEESDRRLRGYWSRVSAS
ncbi:MAG TPA: hypothetical protein VFR93_05030, partial [Candidatus Limnocylindrales bacterium]|nr:hypothetical protein [Candidatus Limnocylindrales bacterium]